MDNTEFQKIKARAEAATSGAIHKVCKNQWDDLHEIQIPNRQTGTLHFPEESEDCELFAHAKDDILAMVSFLESLKDENPQTIAAAIKDLFRNNQYIFCFYWHYLDDPETDTVVAVRFAKKPSDQQMHEITILISDPKSPFRKLLRDAPKSGMDAILQLLDISNAEVLEDETAVADEVGYLPIIE